MDLSFLLTTGIKLYNSGQVHDSLPYFLKVLEIYPNATALYYLCEYIVNHYDRDHEILDVISNSFRYVPINIRLKLIDRLAPSYPEYTHRMYSSLLVEKIPVEIKRYILHQLCYRPCLTNTDLISRTQHLKSLLECKVDDKTLCKYIVCRQYISSSEPLIPLNIDINEHFQMHKHQFISHKVSVKRSCTYVGILTSDLDKSSTSMFYYDIINSLDPDKFKVFVYYTDDNESMNNQTANENNHVLWFNIHGMHTNIVYRYIHDIHKIDVLVDLQSFRSPIIIRLLALRPAIKQINYTSINNIPLDCYTHTIVDKYTNPKVPNAVILKGVTCLFRLCTPSVSRDFQMNKLVHDHTRTIIGIVNDKMQMSLKCVLVYNAIASRHKHVTYVVKGECIPKLKNAVYITDSTCTLSEYYKLFNTVDYLIDAFPYSGTGATAAALYMGCPVLSFYNPELSQITNTSSSMNFNCDLDRYVFRSTRSILNFDFKQFRDNHQRKCIHKSFVNSMNVGKFMSEFEKILT
jgi:hypothetical protein